MTDEPHLHNVPTNVGGVGRDGVRVFYHDHLVGKFFPPDVTMTPVSRTVGDDQQQVARMSEAKSGRTPRLVSPRMSLRSCGLHRHAARAFAVGIFLISARIARSACQRS
jgi:hypothetical protein